jgi:hypothetical protein
MAATFSQNLMGISAQHVGTIPKLLTMADTDIAGNAVSMGNVNAVGAQQGATSRNDYIFCKGVDGRMGYHTIDAERSILPGYIVLRKV